MARPTIPASASSVISGVLASPVANGGTFVVPYPKQQPGSLNAQVRNKGFFFGVGGHALTVGQSVCFYPSDFELTLGTPAAGVTVTWRRAQTLPTGATYRLQLNEMRSAAFGSSGVGDVCLINLGAPVAAAAADVCAAQAITGTAPISALVNGTRAVSGVAYMDAPRGVTVVSSGADTTQTISVFGTDAYGQAMRENFAAAGTTPVVGKKAFQTVTRVESSAAMVGNLSVGASNVLGLPVFMPGAGYILKELQDGAAATAGTFVAGAAAGTSADVRGTYTPNVAPDGTKVLHIIAFVANPADIGGPQFS